MEILKLRRFLLTTFLLCAVCLSYGQMCKVELSSPTKSLGVQGKQTVFVEATFSETYQKKKTVLEPVQRQPLNVSIVLDVSGSMAGEPLSGAKQAMLSILNNLFPGDVISITVFSDQAKVVLPFAQIGGANSNKLQEGINSIVAEGTTCLFSGVKEGAKALLANAGTNYENYLVVISDGESGETPLFMNDVGQKLLKEDVRLICIGLDYDNPLLQSLANGANGQYHHIGQSNELPMILMTALEKSNVAASVAFDNKFALHLPPNVVLLKSTARILGVKTLKDKSTVYYFYRFSLPEKSVYSELFELEITRQLKPGVPIAQLQVSFIDAAEVDLKKKEEREKQADNAAKGAAEDNPKSNDEDDLNDITNDILQKLKITEQSDDSLPKDEKENDDNSEEQEPDANNFRFDIARLPRSTDSASLTIPFTTDKTSSINSDFYIECRIRFETSAYDLLYIYACRGLTSTINERLKQHLATLNRQIRQPIVDQSESTLRQFKQNTEDLIPLVKSVPAKPSGSKKQQSVKKQTPRNLKDNPFIEKLNVFRANFIEQWRELREKRTLQKAL